MFKPLLLMLVGLAIVGFSGKHVFDERKLASDGVEVAIEPLKEYTTTVRKRHTQTDTSFSANVSFTTAAGERVTVKKSLSYDQLDKLTRGQRVSIRYLPNNPKTSRLEGEAPWTWDDVGLGALLLAIGAFWLWRVSHAPITRDR